VTGAARRLAAAPLDAASTARARLPVVGIGASAGGLEALRAFFGALPSAPGFAFVVVTHLDPTHESLMPELLAKSTTLSVVPARDRDPLEADHVYIVPPNRLLTIDQGLIRVREAVDRRSLRGVIDHFFRSLADDQRDGAVAVILSGTGTEGALGLREVKAQGGMVMAQTPDTASQSGMPTNAIATGLVDFVLPPDQMPKALVEYARSTRLHRAAALPAEDTSLNGLPAILSVLRARRKHDFRGYKKGTISRRVERRMGLHHIKNVDAYVTFLRAHPEEADLLFKDLLISVTSFFRDPLAFNQLAARVLSVLMKEKETDTPIRIWVPGCATGEEAYSIGILAAEQAAAAHSARRVQIFATDVDEHALDVARRGVYPESIALDVGPQRLTRFFARGEHRFTIVKSIRESVTFAVQNLIEDPPFSKLDLISCRNVLIYLEPALQEKILSLFHFALNPGGYLFLGNAEGVGQRDTLFAPVSKPGRIFQRLETAQRSPLRVATPQPAAAGTNRLAALTAIESSVAVLANEKLLEYFAPAAVVVKRNGEMVRLYGAMDRYIHLPAGQASLDVLNLAREPLKSTLRAAFHDAVRRNRLTMLDTLDVKRGRSRTPLRITLRPFDSSGATERLWLIIFDARVPPVRASAPSAPAKPPALARRLAAELRATKREQQRLIEQLEGSNEEQKAANEEVLSMNEELQSANEELVTSKEELQSMNEELATLNTELQEKVQAVTEARDDLANLLVSTDIATVFVDLQFRVKRFTSAAGRLLNLLPSDVGRPIDHVATTLVNVDLLREAQAVMGNETHTEKSVDARDGRHYILRVLPYRSEAQIVQGVVVTLADVTRLQTAQDALELAKKRVSDDLRHMSRLHDVGTQLAGTGSLPELLDVILRAAIDITHADMGNVQLLDEPGRLTIVAQRGFEQPFLDFFRHVEAGDRSACAATLDSRRRVVVDDVTQSSVFQDAESLNVLLAAGVRAVQSTPLVSLSGTLLGVLSTHTRTAAPFSDDDFGWLDLLARQAADLIERMRLQDVRASAKAELEQRVDERTKRLALLHDISQAIDTAPNWVEALHLIMRRIGEAEGWQVGHVYVPAPDDPDRMVAAVGYFSEQRFAPFSAASGTVRYARGESLAGRVFGDGHPIWMNDHEAVLKLLPPIRAQAAAQVGLQSVVAVPARVENRVAAVLELLSDQLHHKDLEFERLLEDVSVQLALVLERERTMAQVAEILWGEQQDLIHTLHDSLGQQLTGLGMLGASLNQRLKTSDVESARVAQEIARTAGEALERVRELSRGLFPPDIDGAGFVEALRRLASATQALHGIPCVMGCDTPITISSSRVATQLYRIAQEAVTNSLRHAEAQHITISLRVERGATTLKVADDGVGLHRRLPNENGIGLKIMRHRAISIGALFSVDPGADGGTVVTCVVPGLDLVTSVPQSVTPAERRS